MRRRDPASRRLALIDLTKRALRGDEEASIVLEDAFREYAPREKQYLADYLHDHRGYFQEAATLRHILEYLEEQPFNDALARVIKVVEATMSRAWKRGVIDRSDERRMPFLRHMPEHVRSAFHHALRGESKRQVREEIARTFGFSYRPPTQAQIRLATRVANIIYKAAQ
jgi:hypothetical protein